MALRGQAVSHVAGFIVKARWLVLSFCMLCRPIDSLWTNVIFVLYLVYNQQRFARKPGGESTESVNWEEEICLVQKNMSFHVSGGCSEPLGRSRTECTAGNTLGYTAAARPSKRRNVSLPDCLPDDSGTLERPRGTAGGWKQSLRLTLWP